MDWIFAPYISLDTPFKQFYSLHIFWVVEVREWGTPSFAKHISAYAPVMAALTRSGRAGGERSVYTSLHLNNTTAAAP
jgi:hypothetical protein